MSGTNTAFNAGYERGLKGLPDDNPFPQHFSPGNNFDRYRQGYAAGLAVYGGKSTSKWRLPQPAEKPYPKGMSRDRVIFLLPEVYFRSEMYPVMRKGLGFSADDVSTARNVMRDSAVGGIMVVCRPSQFARFIILRNDAGMRNGFKELKTRLVPDNEVEAQTWDVDVSKNKPY